MIKILWHEIKNYLKGNKMVFILSILAFTFSCVMISMTMYNYLQSSGEQKIYEESYGNKVFYKIAVQGETEVYTRIFGNDYKEQIKTAFEQLKNSPLFEYKYRTDAGVQFFNPLDDSYGSDDFPPYKEEFLVGYERANTEFSLTEYSLSLKAIYADRLLLNEPHVSLASGEWFSENDFTVDNPNDIQLPVIMGADYRNLYEIGDTLANAHYGSLNPITLRVMGFLEQDSWYYDNNNQKQLLNRYMIISAPEVNYNYIFEDGNYDEFFKACYDSLKISNARIICDQANAEEVQKRVYQIFNDNQLYELMLNYETSGAQRGLDEIKSVTASSMAISIFTLLLSILMFSIQAHYKLMKYKKKYGIYMMSGITSKQLFMVMITDTILLFALSNILTIITIGILKFITTNFLGYSEATFSYLEAAIVIIATEFVLLCYMGLSGHKKVHKIDMSAALREHE